MLLVESTIDSHGLGGDASPISKSESSRGLKICEFNRLFSCLMADQDDQGQKRTHRAPSTNGLGMLIVYIDQALGLILPET